MLSRNRRRCHLSQPMARVLKTIEIIDQLNNFVNFNNKNTLTYKNYIVYAGVNTLKFMTILTVAAP